MEMVSLTRPVHGSRLLGRVLASNVQRYTHPLLLQFPLHLSHSHTDPHHPPIFPCRTVHMQLRQCSTFDSRGRGRESRTEIRGVEGELVAGFTPSTAALRWSFFFMERVRQHVSVLSGIADVLLFSGALGQRTRPRSS